MERVITTVLLLLTLRSSSLSIAQQGHGEIGPVSWTFKEFNSLLSLRKVSENPQPPKVQLPTVKPPKPTSRPSQPISPYSQEQKDLDPYQKLYNWANSDSNLSQSLDQDHVLSSEQQLKIIRYMANDSYFQSELIKQLKENKDNAWLNELPPRAQIRYLKAIANLKEGDLADQTKKKIVEQRLKDDYDIEPFYQEFIKTNPNAKPLQTAFQTIISNYL